MPKRPTPAAAAVSRARSRAASLDDAALADALEEYAKEIADDTGPAHAPQYILEAARRLRAR